MLAAVGFVQRMLTAVVDGKSATQMRPAGGALCGDRKIVNACRFGFPVIVHAVTVVVPLMIDVLAMVHVPVRISLTAVPVEPTFTVPLNVAFPVTVRRPATVVVWPARLIVTDVVVEAVPRVSGCVALESIPNPVALLPVSVPPIAVLPVDAATVNFVVLMARSPRNATAPVVAFAVNFVEFTEKSPVTPSDWPTVALPRIRLRMPERAMSICVARVPPMVICCELAPLSMRNAAAAGPDTPPVPLIWTVPASFGVSWIEMF